MLKWTARAWHEAGLRLEPSAASALAAVAPLMASVAGLERATHVAWTTGGSLLPEEEFARIVGGAAGAS